MCLPLSQGGRRCPIHRHSSLAAAAVASNESGLNLRQVDNLFRELRREGRNAEPLAPTAYAAGQAALIGAASGTDIETRVLEHVAASVNESTPDSATQYAQRLLVERARVRGQRLQSRFAEVAARTGFTTEEIAAKFQEAYRSVDVSRGTEAPDEYSTTTRARAVTANLPYDRASVVALERIAALPAQQARERRISEASFQTPTSNSHVARFGYDEGRLEIAFNNDPSNVYAYHDVPENVWEHLRTAQRPGRIYSHYIRGNADYMYESAEAAEADAYRVRCESCGQFRAAVHTCPERVEREEIVAAGVPVEHVAEAVAQARHEALVEARDAQPDVENINVLAAETAEPPVYVRDLDTNELSGPFEDYQTAHEWVLDQGGNMRYRTETSIADAENAPTREEMAADFEATARQWAAEDAESVLNRDRSLEPYEDDSLASLDERRNEYARDLLEEAAETNNSEYRTELENLYEQLMSQPVDEGNDPVLTTDPDELAAGLHANEDGTVEFTPYSEEDAAETAEEAAAPARRARTPRRSNQPEAGSVRSTASIVVPEAGFQVPDNQFARPEISEATAPAAYGNFPVKDPEAPAYADAVVNADSQYNPQRFDPRSLVAYETEEAAHRYGRMVLHGGIDPRNTYGARRFTEADAQTIINAPENMRFVMKDTGAWGQPYSPVLAYDYNRYEITTGERPNENGTTTTVLQLRRKYSTAQNPFASRSMSENPEGYEAATAAWNTARDAEDAEFSRMREAGTLTSIAANASSSRRYVFDANLRQQPSISTGPVTEIRAAFRENKVVQVPMTVKFGRDATDNNEYMDDQGYTINPDRHIEITGNMRVRRGADGTIEVMNSERQLRCNCYDYRRRYYCKHLNYLQRHAGNVFQQMIPDSDGAGRTVAAVGEVTRSHRLMSAALRSRTDVEVVSVDGGEDYVRVNAPVVPEGRRWPNYEYSWSYQRRLQTPAYYLPADPDNPTVDEITRLNEFRETIRNLGEIGAPENMTPIRQAVRRSDVDVPMRAEFSYDGGVARVSGSIRIARNADGDMSQVQCGNVTCSAHVMCTSATMTAVRCNAGTSPAVHM